MNVYTHSSTDKNMILLITAYCVSVKTHYKLQIICGKLESVMIQLIL